MTDTDLLNQQERLGIQVWRTPSGDWTAQKMTQKHYPVQPTKPTLREALQTAIETQPKLYSNVTK